MLTCTQYKNEDWRPQLMSVTKKIRKAQKYLEKKKTWKNLRDNLRKNVLGYVRTHAATLLYSGLCNYFVCKLKYLGKKRLFKFVS